MNAASLSRRAAVAVALMFVDCAIILVPVAEGATTTGSAIVTVQLPDTVGPPLEIDVKAARADTGAAVGSCVLSKVLTNPDGSHYRRARLTNLPMGTEVDVTVTTPVPPGVLTQPGFAHLIIFAAVGNGPDRPGAMTLTAAVPMQALEFHPSDMEVVPPEPPPSSAKPATAGSPPASPSASSSVPPSASP